MIIIDIKNRLNDVAISSVLALSMYLPTPEKLLPASSRTKPIPMSPLLPVSIGINPSALSF